MSAKTKTTGTSAPSIEEMIGESGKVKRFRPETETQPRSRMNRDSNIMEVSTDASVPAGNVDEQIMLNETRMREIIGAPIEADNVSEYTSRNAPDTDGEAPDNATTPNVEAETGELPAHAPADENDKTDVRLSVDRSGKMDVGTESTVPSAHATHSEDSEPSVSTTLTTSTKPSEAIAPTPQTEATEPSIDSGDTRNGSGSDTVPTVSILDTDPIRRTVKQRRSDLDEYRQRYMQIPRIVDRKPVFVSHKTRDRLDRIVRLLGERGMSVSGLIENIALHHLETHEPDIEHWRKM